TTFVARIAQPYRPPTGAMAWIDTTSFTPTDSLAFPAGEGIRLSVRATPGAGHDVEPRQGIGRQRQPREPCAAGRDRHCHAIDRQRDIAASRADAAEQE